MSFCKHTDETPGGTYPDFFLASVPFLIFGEIQETLITTTILSSS